MSEFDEAGNRMSGTDLASELLARNRELALINRVLSASVLSADLPETMTGICRELALIFNVPMAATALLTLDETVYEVVAEYCEPGHESALGVHFPVSGNPLVDFMLTHRRPMVIEDVQGISPLALNEHTLANLTARGTVSMLIVPLFARDRLIGTIGLDSPEPRRFSPDEIALAASVAAALSQVLQLTRLNAELQHSQARLRATFDTAAVGLCVTDQQGIYQQVNARWAQMVGQREDVLIGQNHLDLMHPDDRYAYTDLVARLLAGSAISAEHNVRFCDTEGHVFWAAVSLACIRDERQQVTGIVQVVQDITARRLAEEEREQLIRDLDAFAHTVAHDLKNPLGTVMGYAAMLADELRQTPPSDECIAVLQALDSIERSSLRMKEIISELLFFARVRSAGEIPLHAVYMGHTVHNALQRLEFMIQETGAQIVYPDLAQWPVLRSYRAWIEEIWANYLSNALKYGGDHPLITLGYDTLPDGMLRFWVRDQGPGIPPEAQSRLFKQFERLGSYRAEGHGLGLSIVQRIVAKLGGQVGVESQPGEGSLFYFTLPPDFNLADSPDNL